MQHRTKKQTAPVSLTKEETSKVQGGTDAPRLVDHQPHARLFVERRWVIRGFLKYLW